MDSVLEFLGLTPAVALSLVLAAGVFVSFIGVAMPMLAGNQMKTRMRAVALERDQVRARERARLAAEKERGAAPDCGRQTPRGWRRWSSTG